MRTSLRSIAPPPAAQRGPDLLAIAAGIGERLARDAVWYRGQCNWVGPAGGGRNGALGPDLATGTAGVALFLAQLHAATADEAARRTALGAIGQALAHAGDAPAGGSYGGRLGIAYAAARCGLVLADQRLLERAARLARARPAGGAGADADATLRSGAAGSIAALLALARLLDDDRLVRPAERLGDELAGAALRGREGWAWAVPGDRRAHPLCGLADGAGGGALALLELHAVTGERRHRDVAERALDYERHWFDRAEANWPDLRGVQRRERRGTVRSPCAASWSHGAAGIALTRLRAWRILGDERYREEAVTALRATAAGVERTVNAAGADFSLGDGLAGGADVLLLGAELSPDHVPLAARAGSIGAGRYAPSVDGWPCGDQAGGTAPALLTGHAGIGLFYLRLHDGGVPSALVL
jgi:lantibiotic modifying enzyme